jgi:transcriptional regulator with XRE-family HTH domain
VEALVSEDLWNECNALLDASRIKGKHKPRTTQHLFAGLVFCHCERKMYVPSNMTTKYVCWGCRNKIPVDDLEAIFQEELRSFFFSPEEIAGLLELTGATIGERAQLLETLERERKKLTAEIDKLYDLYQSSMIDKHGFGAKYHPLAARQQQLDDEIPEMQAALDVLKISHLSQEEIVSSARDLYTRWPTLPFEERRQIVETITERIIVRDGEVEINLFYAPLCSSSGGSGPVTPEDGGTPPADPQNHGNKATKLHGRVAFLPFTKVTRKAAKARPSPPPVTIGDHIKKIRCERKLLQRDVGGEIGVVAESIGHWEKNLMAPQIGFMPAIIRFLGYDPSPAPETLGERMRAYRDRHGLSVKAAAAKAGVHADSWGDWERTGEIPWERYRKLIAAFLADD